MLDVVDVYDNNNILFSLELITIVVLSSLERLVMNQLVHIEAVETLNHALNFKEPLQNEGSSLLEGMLLHGDLVAKLDL